jgi:hypothetical protein
MDEILRLGLHAKSILSVFFNSVGFGQVGQNSFEFAVKMWGVRVELNNYWEVKVQDRSLRGLSLAFDYTFSIGLCACYAFVTFLYPLGRHGKVWTEKTAARKKGKSVNWDLLLCQWYTFVCENRLIIVGGC